MKKKYLNDALVGNDNMVVSFSNKGELLRLFYPTRDFRQFIETFYTGVKINDSALIYTHEDINNSYKQWYTENTNILNTRIRNSYFNLEIVQTDFVCVKKDVLVKKYVFTNQNSIDLDVHFLLYSNLFSSFNNVVGSKVEENILLQYSHNYTLSIFSKNEIESYRLNNSINEIKGGIISDKDYVGMARDSAISYNIGTLAPGEQKELVIFININDSKEDYRFDELEEKLKKIKNMNVEKEIQNAELYWEKYIEKHDNLEFNNEGKKQDFINIFETEEEYEKAKNVYRRTILTFPLLLNHKTGGISAALEVDEEKDESGRYSYCWPRDAVFISRALDLVNMYDETTKFYTEFARKTQSKNGMWEQRFYTDERLAPCWGYQIDETASIVYGVYEHYKVIKDKKFLTETLDMCSRATEFLKRYIDYIYTGEKTNKKDRFEEAESYDLWEMHQGVHLYSLATIYSAFRAMRKIHSLLTTKQNKEKNEKEIAKLKKYEEKTKKYVEENLCDKNTNVLRRNNKDNIVDVSILAAFTPFKMFEMKDEKVKNTIEKINLTLRTYTGGYIRFENDCYLGGNNPWPIATLWMSIYYMIEGNMEEAKKCINFVTDTSTEHGYLAEQIDNNTMKSKWVIGLNWSHAMYVIAMNLYISLKTKEKQQDNQ